MDQTTSYRMRWRTEMDDLGILAATMEASQLPLHKAREFRDNLEDVAQITKGVSIADLVPTEQVEGPAHWRLDGDTFTFTADLKNSNYRHDGSVFPEVGEPSRETILLGALAKTCNASNGTIVGAWMNQYSDSWQPLVHIDGQIMRGCVLRAIFEENADVVEKHDGRLHTNLLKIDEDRRTVSIPLDALTTID